MEPRHSNFVHDLGFLVSIKRLYTPQYNDKCNNALYLQILLGSRIDKKGIPGIPISDPSGPAALGLRIISVLMSWQCNMNT